MTECRVTCHTCRTRTGGPRVWHWLCEECAQECQDRHRTQTGHDTDLHVTQTLADVIDLTAIAEAALTRRKTRG